MKLYDLKAGTNPRRVRIFMAEKGISIESIEVDMNTGENKKEDYLKKNPMGTMPLLELDDGTYIAESIAICSYLEALHPNPPLFGKDARERAKIDMWTLRMEHEIYRPVVDVFTHLSPFWKGKRQQFPEYGEHRKTVAIERYSWLDKELEGRDFIAGDDYTMADITAQAAFVLGKNTGTPIPDELQNLTAWFKKVSSRPTARA